MTAVGIDLGTTNTVIGKVKGGLASVLPDESGRRLLPSVVSFHPNGDVLVGQSARERRSVDARNTVFSIKRLIGRAWQSDEVARSRERFPFELFEGIGHAPFVRTRAGEHALPEISALVLKRARAIAEKSLGAGVNQAVITVPANFNELQRTSTKIAAEIAGLEVLRMINEPTAAALAYGIGRSDKSRIAIYDFGGGTFDCTLLELSGNVFEVLATSGDSFLGGDDIDRAIAERMADAFLMQHRYDPRAEPQVFERLRAAAEDLKVALSAEPIADCRLREVAFGVGGSHLDLHFGLTISELELLATPLIERTLKVCQDALSIANLPVTAFDEVILVGGSSLMPLVQKQVERFFGKTPRAEINPEEVVALGAAIQAEALTDRSRERPIPPPPTPRFSSTWRGVPGSTAPIAAVPSTTREATEIARIDGNHDGARDEDPDDSVSTLLNEIGDALDPDIGDEDTAPIAISPAVFAARAASENASTMLSPQGAKPGNKHARTMPVVYSPMAAAPILIDVTPRALIVETAGGYCDTVVPRNSKIPCERTRAFATARDGQTAVKIRVAQGEEQAFNRNTYLGELLLTDLRPAIRGEVRIAVTFEVDSNGTLHVHAKDTASGREATAVIKLEGIAERPDIERMKETARNARVRGDMA